jgi:hypothetical protein
MENLAGEDVATALPITHTPPSDPTHAVEIPAITKERLGLDTERSWIILSEANQFVWPGPGLRPTARGDMASVAYGMLPERILTILITRFAELYSTKRASLVMRDE